jgi:transcriptional regulator GlxA family with amidase domain
MTDDPLRGGLKITIGCGVPLPEIQEFPQRPAGRDVQDAVNVARAALDLGTSRRTLERRVRDNVGVTPYTFLQRIRIEQAKHLRQTTSLTLEQIAGMVGYGSSSALRNAMRRER